MDVYYGVYKYVIILSQCHKPILHKGHPGITSMKSFARLHVWWPSLDSDIESCVNSCVNCALNLLKNQLKSHYISGTYQPNLGIVYILILQGHKEGKCAWLLLVDAYSIWLRSAHDGVYYNRHND